MKAILFICVVLSFGCGSQFGRQVETRFPTQNELVELGKTPTTNEYLKNQNRGKRVETWTLHGPLPTMLGETTAIAATPLETLVAHNVDKSATLNMTDSMNCVAREYAIFHAAHKAPPFQSLQRFIETRCGSVANQVRTLVMEGGNVSEADALTSQKEQIEHYLKQFEGFKRRINTGISHSKLGDYSVIVLAYESPSVKITPVPMRSQSGMFVVEGKLEGDVRPERFHGFFTKGEFDTGTCKSQAVDAPAFKFVCTLDAQDRTTYLQIAYQVKDALFSTTAARLLIYPGELGDTYTPPTTRRILTSADTTVKKDSMLETMNELINRVRSSAGRKSISAHVAQSEAVQKLTAPFLESDDAQKTNKLMLGMLAGWEVNDDIVNADLTSDYSDSTDPIQLLEATLETPGGRRTLLSPSVSAFALGTIGNGDSGIGSVFVSYEFLPEEHSNRRIKRVVDALNRERESYGMKKIKENKATRARAENWAKELEGGAAMEDTANDLMEAYIEETGKERVRSYMMLVPDLDEMTFPAEIINKENIELSFVVAPYKPLNSPWTFYAIVVAY